MCSTKGPLGTESHASSQRLLLRPKEPKTASNSKPEREKAQVIISEKKSRQNLGKIKSSETLAEKTKSEANESSNDMPAEYDSRAKKMAARRKRHMVTKDYSTVNQTSELLKGDKVQSGTGGSTTSQLFNKRGSLPSEGLASKMRAKLIGFLAKKNSVVSTFTEDKAKLQLSSYKKVSTSMKALSPSKHFSVCRDA